MCTLTSTSEYLCTLAHTVYTVYTLSTLCVHSCTLCTMYMTGPLWFDQRSGQVLTASRRYVKGKKTAGDLSASLQLNVWRRAEEPGKLTHELVGGGQHARGFTALENPLWFEHGPPHYVADHKVLKFLRHKIAHFLHDYHREWFSKRLGLPPPNRKHAPDQGAAAAFGIITKRSLRAEKARDQCLLPP